MSDKMTPIPLEKLYSLIFSELKNKKTIFGISQKSFFNPAKYPELSMVRYGQKLETPFGVAAGPQTQLAQNIIASWLVGARYIELKTVQTLDELHISKPCIDMEDMGFNCEWSQELKLHESFEEYLNAWIMIHILREELKLKGKGKNKDLGCIFNMSVGYNMEGILNKNVQTFLKRMRNAKKEKMDAIKKLKKVYPKIAKLEIPDCLSNNITLSTMHGCPPHEIEKIGMYLIEELGVHTTIKLNPTLNGPQELRDILNNKLGFKKVTIPDLAFDHDLKYPDALKLIENLRTRAKEVGVDFSIKLTNTLESQNNKNIFDKSNEMMYMSGRPLHVLAINVARKLQKDFKCELDVTFSAGIDAFNAPKVLALGIKPLTICSDLLKPGGYERMVQYHEVLSKEMKAKKKKTLEALVLPNKLKALDEYFAEIIEDKRYHQEAFPWENIKTPRLLPSFDCIKAPCIGTCPTNQNIPSYMSLCAQGKAKEALNVIYQNNPFPNTTGLACDHICEDKCTRMNYDEPLKIRDIKRFIAMKDKSPVTIKPKRKLGKSIAIIGGGPSGLSCAFFLALEGFKVEVFEAKSPMGGMISHALPDFRTAKGRVERDIKRIKSLGVKFHEDHPIATPEEFNEICAKFDYVYLGLGASKGKALGAPGEETKGVIDFLKFLDEVKMGRLTKLPKKVAVIGGGNSAIDAVRSAKRLLPKGGEVLLVYRRTVTQMPASREEIEELLEENIKVLELTAPEEVLSEKGKITGLRCSKMKLGEKDSSGRARPVKVEGSDFVLELDYLIKAIGQDTDVDFLKGVVDLTPQGLVPCNGVHETNIPNVFVGGDLARGPSSIIKGIADGKEAAYEIMRREGVSVPTFKAINKKLKPEDLRLKRATREYGVELPKSALSKRDDFSLVVQTLSEKEAKKEASRCLMCDEICNTCVTVCPNRANWAYQIKSKSYEVTDLIVEGDELTQGRSYEVTLNQKDQVLNIGDYCNECGNCGFFCPTAGRPYINKPKVYLFEKSYKAEKHNAHYLERKKGDVILHSKFEDYELRLIEKKGAKTYTLEAPFVKLVLDKATLEPIKAAKGKGEGTLHFDNVVTMATLLEELKTWP